MSAMTFDNRTAFGDNIIKCFVDSILHSKDKHDAEQDILEKFDRKSMRLFELNITKLTRALRTLIKISNMKGVDKECLAVLFTDTPFTCDLKEALNELDNSFEAYTLSKSCGYIDDICWTVVMNIASVKHSLEAISKDERTTELFNELMPDITFERSIECLIETTDKWLKSVTSKIGTSVQKEMYLD